MSIIPRTTRRRKPKSIRQIPCRKTSPGSSPSARIAAASGFDPDCAADILANPEDYYDSLYIFFPAANFTVEVYSSSGELVAEKPVFYENYAVGEKLRGTDTEQIHLYGLAPDTYTVVIKES